MDEFANPLSMLLSLFLAECYSNKSLRSEAFEYSAKHSKTRTLSTEREKFHVQTESAINSIRNFETVHQVRAFIRKQSIEVQYFIFERALTLTIAAQHDSRLGIRRDDNLDKFGYIVAQAIQETWEQHLKHLALDEIDLDTHVSHIYHGYLS